MKFIGKESKYNATIALIESTINEKHLKANNSILLNKKFIFYS